MSKYVKVDSGGDESGDQRAYAMLYPNRGPVKSNCESGSDITWALDYAFRQLESNNSIDYYEVSRFDVDNYAYPDVYATSSSELSTDFSNWLRNGSANGTGTDLKESYFGCHMLVHRLGDEQKFAGADYGDTPCSDYPDEDELSSFSEGKAAWTPVSDDWDLRRNSAIQESVHTFIKYKLDDVAYLAGGGSVEDEHGLGELRDYDVSPMLTYHWDTSENDSTRSQGQCSGDDTGQIGYTQTLTSCTIDAVDITAGDICDPAGQNDPGNNKDDS